MTPWCQPTLPKKKVSAIYLFIYFVWGPSIIRGIQAMCSARVLGLLPWALRHEQERGKVSKYHFFPLGLKRLFLIIGNPSIDPEPLGRTAAGTAPNHTMDSRSAAGPRALMARLGQNTPSSLQRRLPVLSGSPASQRRFSPRVGLFTPETLWTM